MILHFQLILIGSVSVNPSKMERTQVLRSNERIGEEWRMVRKKLGSLLGDEVDVARRKQLASGAFTSMFYLWKRRSAVSEHLRL